MFVKLSVILLIVQLAAAEDKILDWELAIVIDNQIKLLQSNGSSVESTSQPFTKLKALTYDNIRNQFVVSDTDQFNDTIYTVQLTKETDTDITPIIQDLPDDVQGLAVDPITDLLYWTDAINRTINYVPLNETSYESKTLFAFDDKYPHAIAIDICKRHIYWTNSNPKGPTIERANLDGTGHEVLVKTGIVSPEGIAIDYKSQRLYWTDTLDGSIYGKIESTNLDGKEREVVFEGKYVKPFGIAVDGEIIYWTDINNNALYKYNQKLSEPEKITEFDERPMGLVVNNVDIKDLPDCRNIELGMETYKEYKRNNVKPIAIKEEEIIKDCLNDGELLDNYCKCKRGFTGKHCELSMCHNYCVTGDCYLSSMGKPQCRCDRGFVGERCQRNKCDEFCINNGECSISSSKDWPTCQCPDDFVGVRCEYGRQICDIYCQDREDGLFLESYELLCRCSEGFNIFSHRNGTAALYANSRPSLLEKLNDPLYYLTALLFACILIIIALAVYIRTVRKRRPRIKKRIIVNKNVTPLTYRPQPTTEQCEITIENCCNMNVCETPCFEPRGFQEDKKTLLSNMEADDLY